VSLQLCPLQPHCLPSSAVGISPCTSYWTAPCASHPVPHTLYLTPCTSHPVPHTVPHTLYLTLYRRAMLLEMYTRDGTPGVCMIAADIYEGIRWGSTSSICQILHPSFCFRCLPHAAPASACWTFLLVVPAAPSCLRCLPLCIPQACHLLLLSHCTPSTAAAGPRHLRSAPTTARAASIICLNHSNAHWALLDLPCSAFHTPTLLLLPLPHLLFFIA
jgi:hypothetical protein